MVDFLLTQDNVPLRVYHIVLFFFGIFIGYLPQISKAWRGYVTYLHEMGHALTAILFGRKVRRIKVRLWIGGHTDFVGPKGIGNIAIAWFGYAAPATVVLLAAAVLISGYISFTIWFTAALILLLTFLHRSFWGIFFSLLSLFLVVGFGALSTSQFTLSAFVLLLGLILGGGMRALYNLTAVRLSSMEPSQYDPEVTDSEALQRMTLIPARVWEYSWWGYSVLSGVATMTVLLIISRNG